MFYCFIVLLFYYFTHIPFTYLDKRPLAVSLGCFHLTICHGKLPTIVIFPFLGTSGLAIPGPAVPP